MAIKSDYISGTLTVTQGSILFTGTGTGWESAGFKEGDTLIDITGATEYMGVIESITGEATGTLTKAWEGPTLSNVPYRMRYQPDGARSTAQARNLIEILGNGNITAFALLNGAANLLPMFTGPGAMTLITKQALVSGAAYDIQVNTLADRAAYDGQDLGYSVLVSNIGDGRSAIYSKNSATSGDWSDPAYVTGAVGPVVQIQAGTTTTLGNGQNATVLVRPITDGYALDFGIPRGIKGDNGAPGPEGPRGEGLQIDATGTLAERSLYNSQPEGFSYVDVEGGNLYFRVGDTPGVWSDPIPFGKGDKGDPGDSGATIVTTNGVGNGTVGPYTLNEAPTSVSATWASISGVTQYDFTLSGNQITFSIPIETGIAWQVKSSGVLSVVVPADGSVGAAKINTSEAAGIRTAINAAAKPATAVAGNIGVFNAQRELVDTGVTKATNAQGQAGTNDVNYMTPATTAAAILSLSPPTDTSDLYSNIGTLALALADLQGYRLSMKGGVADPFDDETGIYYGVSGGNDEYTSALLHADGVNGATSTVDSSPAPYPINLYGGAALGTDQFKFGTSSLKFNGSSSFAQFNGQAGFAFGTGDFTIDTQIRLASATGGQSIYDGRPAGTEGTYVYFYVTGSKLTLWANSAIRITGTTTLVAGTWYHVALVRNSGVTTIYLNGVVEGSWVDAINYLGAAGRPNIGIALDNSSNPFNGHMDEYRVSKGIARWTAPFTPPTAAYSGYSGGSLNWVYDPALDLYKPSGSSTAPISGALGTAFGNMTIGGGLAGAFDGITDQSAGGSAGILDVLSAYVGRSHSSTIGKVVVHGSNNASYDANNGLQNVTLNLYGKTGSAPANATDGTLLGSITFTELLNESVGRTINSNDTTTVFAHRWVQIVTAGALTNLYIAETTYYQPESINNMTLISTPYTATAVPTIGRLSVQIDTPLTLVPGTDFVAEMSRNGGTTWTAGTLSLTSTIGTIKTYDTADISLASQSSGTSMMFRIRTLTNKNIPVSGVVMQWR